MNDIVVGLDAGGSKTRVIVATTRGEVLADVTGPGAVMTPGNAEHCADLLVTQVELALASAEAQYKPKVLYAGVAGTGREAEQMALQDALTNRELAEEVVVDTDASVAFADAFGEGAGVLLIAGSGSIAFGRSPGKVEARCGGWGITFGDEGSGAWIGKRALSVVASAHDGREPVTALTGAILTAAQVNEPEQLIPWGIAADKEALAALAPSVMAVAMQEDLRANAIIDIAVEELVLHVRALGKRLFIDERAAFDLALSGGLLVKGSLIRKRLERRLKTAVPGATLKTGEIVGARGAVRIARQMVGVSPVEALLGKPVEEVEELIDVENDEGMEDVTGLLQDETMEELEDPSDVDDEIDDDDSDDDDVDDDESDEELEEESDDDENEDEDDDGEEIEEEIEEETAVER